MPNSPFNSKFGFDLGDITTINVVATPSGSTNRVLVLKPDGAGKFLLSPEALSATTGSSQTYTPASGSSYMKKEVFSATTSTTTQTTIKTFDFNIGTSTKLYLIMKLDLMGQGNIGGGSEYYHFTTGYNLVADNTADSRYYYRHIPGHFSYLFNKNGSPTATTLKAVGPDRQFQMFSDIPSVTSLRLQPKFSTLNSTSITNTSVLTTPANIPYPLVTHSINSSTQGTLDDTLRLTLSARSIQSSETINWFGSVEFIASIT